METITLTCPSCSATLTANASIAGKRVKCPKCEHIFTAPASTAVQTAAPWAGGAAVAEGAAPGFVRGQRVFAQGQDWFWYPATVQSCDTQSVKVTYDDGSTNLVDPEAVRPIDLRVGDRVFGRWQGGSVFFPGKITRMAGETLDIAYDDGDRETTTLGLIRVVRGELRWRVGDRVLGQWHGDGFYYPATIKEIRDGIFIAVAFDDGDASELLPVYVRPLDLRVGDRIFCRWQKGEAYYRGRITEKNGEKIHVHYDDGDKEWSNIGLVRVMPDTLGRARQEGR